MGLCRVSPCYIRYDRQRQQQTLKKKKKIYSQLTVYGFKNIMTLFNESFSVLALKTQKGLKRLNGLVTKRGYPLHTDFPQRPVLSSTANKHVIRSTAPTLRGRAQLERAINSTIEWLRYQARVEEV